MSNVVPGGINTAQKRDETDKTEGGTNLVASTVGENANENENENEEAQPCSQGSPPSA